MQKGDYMTKFLRNSKSSVLNRMIVFIGVMLIFGVAYSAITGCDDANRANEVVVDPHLEDGTQPPGGVTPPPSDEIPPDYGTPPSETDTTAPTILERNFPFLFIKLSAMLFLAHAPMSAGLAPV